MACGPEKFRYQDDLMLDESGEKYLLLHFYPHVSYFILPSLPYFLFSIKLTNSSFTKKKKHQSFYKYSLNDQLCYYLC